MTERARHLRLVQPTDDISVPLIGETYAALVNRKVLVPSAVMPYFAIEKHLLFRLMEVALLSIEVDEDWYLSRNSDVADAVLNGSIRSASHHYRRFGFFEHRMPYAIDVAEEWYLESYADVKEGLLREGFASAQVHFETVGFREGRLPYPNFNLAMRKSAPAAPHLPQAATSAGHD